MKKYDGLRDATAVSLPGEAYTHNANFSTLKPGHFGFPRTIGCYVHVAETTEPIRVEMFNPMTPIEMVAALRRVYLYSKLLPGCGFPVKLDIADKYAHIPAWMTGAYGKLIRYHLGISLQQGEIRDVDMRRILIEALYMTNRDWLFRPTAQWQ
jgi:hypothetical protein